MNGFIFNHVKGDGLYSLIAEMTGGASHCGIAKDGKVIHSTYPSVCVSELDEFLDIGGGVYSLRTTGDASLDSKAFDIAFKYLGLPYDYSFNAFNENSCYCSKLLWLTLKELGYPVPKPKLATAIASLYVYGDSLKQYYGDDIPTKSMIVTPRMMQDSLKLVKHNYPEEITKRNGFTPGRS